MGIVKSIDILDTTLRDGSYTINYQFSSYETALLAHGLELAGIKYIEIGHGLGLGAHAAGKGAQLVSDLDYMRACSAAIQSSRFGFFYIPGIGKLSDIKLLADEGGGFVRIGVALEAAEQAFLAIKEARLLGLEVWVNVMKTYAYQTSDLIDRALQFVHAGAEGVYIVDSAGGMLPSEVSNYVAQLKYAFKHHGINARLGFHGHDNLSLATSCSLSAVEAGCDIVDGSLLGIGRSMGNAATEVLAMVFERAGYKTGVNPWQAADLAEEIIKPFLEKRWRYDPVDQALGYKQVHSGFLPLIEKAAKNRKVKIRDVVVNLSDGARANVTQELANLAAEFCSTNSSIDKLEIESTRSSLEDQSSYAISMPHANDDIFLYIEEIISQSLRMNKTSAIVFTRPWVKPAYSKAKFQQIRLLADSVVGAIEVSSVTDLLQLIDSADGKIDVIFLDKSPHSASWDKAVSDIDLSAFKSRVLPYSDEMAGLIAACQIVSLEAEKKGVEEVLVLGKSTRSKALTFMLPFWGLLVAKEGSAAPIIVLAGTVEDSEIFLSDKVCLVFDIMSGGMSAKNAKNLISRKIELIRLDGTLALSGSLTWLLDIQQHTDNIIGRSTIGNIPVVAGGAWGLEGDVVIDSIKKPTKVLGVADGKGGLESLQNGPKKNSINEVLTLIKLERLSKIFGA